MKTNLINYGIRDLAIAISLITIGAAGTTYAITPDQLPPLSAQWIWAPDTGNGLAPAYRGYNEMVTLTKQTPIGNFAQATMRVTADSWYRLEINGNWVADGPGRAWPEHFQYDVLDVSGYLIPNAQNTITITAKYFGIGTFHVVPQQAGALAQLDTEDAQGNISTALITDNTWVAANQPQWVKNTPKVSIQMEGAELYDARLEGTGVFSPAAVLYNTNEGPWGDLNPRDVALFSRTPMYFKSFLGANIVKNEGLDIEFRPTDLNYPGFIEANSNTSMAGGIVTLLENKETCELDLVSGNPIGQGRLRIAIDGQEKSGKVKLDAGKHLLVALSAGITGHDREKELLFRGNTAGLTFSNILEQGYENPWSYIHFPECYYSTNDYSGYIPENAQKNAKYGELSNQILSQKTADDLLAFAKDRLKNYPSNILLLQDNYWMFWDRKCVKQNANELVKNASHLIHNNAGATTVLPSQDGDVELIYDLGEQSCGYYTFALNAKAGTILDIYEVEYITPDGTIQVAQQNRNSLRYITKEGQNQFTSIKRRSGRYIFLTLRNMTAPVQIQNMHVVESTYPVNYQGSFQCSDSRLSQIWDISTRTLKLCMEDTYTDCPLYEQTHWVGDARNESLFGYAAFGAEDLGKRCINITAQSLDHYPFAGCQTPSCWDTLIPVWSCLWGISVYDYYWQTGDTEFAKQYFPYVIRNIQGMAKDINQDGLFSGAYWNMFDWSGADQGRRTVIHNSMFLVGAIDAALDLSAAIGGTDQDKWLRVTRGNLVHAINKTWNEEKKSYPDSIHDDGNPSGSTCIHTSFLSLLYDIIGDQNKQAAIENVLNKPEKMVPLGSPFAVLYLYQTLDKLGEQAKIIDHIYDAYLPMLQAGSTTVWETFPAGSYGTIGFPTRSHCHAWSAAPTLFLPRIILGIVPTAPGGAEVEISPKVINDITWAKGSLATHNGPVHTSWRLDGDTIHIKYTAPEGTKVTFKTNPTLKKYKVAFDY